MSAGTGKTGSTPCIPATLWKEAFTSSGSTRQGCLAFVAFSKLCKIHREAAAAEERPGVPGARRPRRRRGILSAREVLLMLAICCCLATLVWFMRSNVKLS